MIDRIDDVECSETSIIECLGISRRTFTRWKKSAKMRNRKKKFSLYETLFMAILCADNKENFYFHLYCGGHNIEEMEESLFNIIPLILNLLTVRYSYDVTDSLDAILKKAGLEHYIPKRNK